MFASFRHTRDSPHPGRGFCQRVEIRTNVKDIWLVDHPSDHCRQDVVDNLLVRSLNQRQSLTVHKAPPSRKNGKTRLSGVSASIAFNEMSMSSRVRSARFCFTFTRSTSFTRGSADRA